ncbi:glycosyltransferase [Rhodobacteraceae bacterium 63075]|nr:glycosyltransferase [Rhodobacteraceae bacterium 63075]
MRAPISVIIPVLDGEAGLPATLGALGEGLEAGLIRELVLSDGGSRDATRAIAESAGAVWAEGAPGRGAQIARGVAVAQGEWLLILHADTVLEAGWAGAVRAHINQHRGMAAHGDLAFTATGPAPRIVAGWANLRSRLFGLPYGDQALLVEVGLLDELGGYPELPLMEDVAMARKLRGRFRRAGFIALTSARRYETEGWLRRGARNLVLLLRYFCGADPHDLARAYRPSRRRS